MNEAANDLVGNCTKSAGKGKVVEIYLASYLTIMLS